MDISEEELKILCKIVSFYIKKFPINDDKVIKKLIKKILLYRVEILLGDFS